MGQNIPRCPFGERESSDKSNPHLARERAEREVLSLKVAERNFQVPMPNSPLLLNYLCFGARFLQESRLTT